MKTYLTEKLQELGASMEESQSGFSIKFASGDGVGVVPSNNLEYELDVSNEKAMSTPTFVGAATFLEIAKYDHAETKIKGDTRLSDFGKEERLTPLRNSLVRAIAYSKNELDRHQTSLAKQEFDRYAPPPADPANLRQALEDSRVWAWYSSLEQEELHRLYGRVNTGEDIALVHSILRDPVKVGALPELARNGWKAAVDQRDPEGRAMLDAAHAVSAWGERAIAIAHGYAFAKRVKMEPEQLYWLTADLNGEKHFNFSPSQVVQYKQRRALREKGALAQ